jgi:uroporphyrin-III C-methyltransferase
VKTSQAWISKYFDTRSRNTTAAMATLKQVGESPVAIAVPDINPSLAAVRTARAAREKR